MGVPGAMTSATPVVIETPLWRLYSIMNKKLNILTGLFSLVLVFAFLSVSGCSQMSKGAEARKVEAGAKCKDGKCGEGKCGESSCTKKDCKKGCCAGEKKCGEGKCGEGKCGEGKCGESKCGDGKCGDGKCGK